jgi:hypothetical protein
LLPVHPPVIQVNSQVIVHKGIQHHDIVSSATEHNPSHTVVEQVIRDDSPAQLIIEINCLH